MSGEMWETVDTQVPMRPDIVIEVSGDWWFARSAHASSIAKSMDNAIDGIAVAEYIMSIKGKIRRK